MSTTPSYFHFILFLDAFPILFYILLNLLMIKA